MSLRRVSCLPIYAYPQVSIPMIKTGRVVGRDMSEKKNDHIEKNVQSRQRATLAKPLSCRPSPGPRQSMEKWRLPLSREFSAVGARPGAWPEVRVLPWRARDLLTSYSAPGYATLCWSRNGVSTFHYRESCPLILRLPLSAEGGTRPLCHGWAPVQSPAFLPTVRTFPLP